ncbi:MULTISPECIES: FbpB family small basic protein [Virgibacillus]|uniref:FbpB family small basic protein n=1 Tax=Virgibacillus TaxID=84406 RepID=UPI003182F637
MIYLLRNGNTTCKKEWITISLKKRLSFDELVKENRRQILEDRTRLEEIEEGFEMKHRLLNKKKTEQ